MSRKPIQKAMIVATLFLGLSRVVQAQENHDESSEYSEASSDVGPGKAVTEAHREKGLKLSPSSLKTLGIRSELANISGGAATVAPSSVLSYQDETGVYRLRDGWFKLIDVKVVDKKGGGFRVRTPDLRAGDRVVTEGGALLRLADLNIWSSESGHGH